MKMKFKSIRTLLILLLLSSSYVSSYAQVTVSAKNKPVKQIISQIEKASGYSFFYSNEMPDLNKQKSLQVKNVSVNDALDQLFTGTNIAYQIKENKQIVLTQSAPKAKEQKRKQIKGSVTDASKEPLIGVVIQVEGEDTNGSVTDVDGKFTLNVAENSVLKISYLGFLPKQVKVGSQDEFNIVLEESDKQLEEVVVVGYGSQKKSDLTGGIVSIGKEKLEMVSTSNLMDRISGQVAGFNVTTENATPGQDQTLRVRGENSLSANNNPLIILDGIPYNGSLNDINPDIIENMTILKDASSAAIYGSRAANGVILIQTMKGKKGEAHVTYRGQVGFSEPEQRLDMMDGGEYLRFMQDTKRYKYGWTDDKLNPENILSASELENYKKGYQNNWQDIIFRTAFTMNHQIAISGGTDNTTYMASVSHLSQEGVMANSKMTRENIALNITQVLNKWLTIGVGTQYVQREVGGVTPNIEHGLKQSPYGPLRNENGNYFDYPTNGQTLMPNPMSNVNADSDNTSRNFFLNAFAEAILPLKGLSLRTNFGYNYRSNFTGTYYGRNTLDGKKVNGRAMVYNTHSWDYTWENLIKYNRDFGAHKVDLTGLFSIQQTEKKYAAQTGENFVNDESSYYNMAAAESNKTITSSLTETAMVSYMLRMNYSYAGKYLLTLTGRSDGYSAFGDNNKYAFFPSVAAAWNISSENFMDKTTPWLNMLKLRVSYGSNGNQAISPYQTLDRLHLNYYIWGDKGSAANGAYLSNDGIGNPDLKWETTKTFNTGVDFSLFKSRLNGNIEFYVANTSDLLMVRTVPIMNGYSKIWDNVGKTRNIGVEVSLNSTNVETKDFTWNTSLNFSLNRDKIVDLRGDKKDDITNKWFIGKPLRVYYDYNVTGLWQEGDKFTYTAEDGTEKEIQPGAKPGSAKLEDVDNNGYINSDDKKIIGSKMPSFLMSIGNRFTYKNFYASFLLNGTFNVTRELNEANIGSWSYGIYNYLSGKDYWTPENPNAEYASLEYTPYDGHSFYKKLTYIQLKNITIGYNFQKNFLNKLGVSDININLSANNVYTFCGTRSFLNYENSWMASYPTARSYILGLNLTF